MCRDTVQPGLQYDAQRPATWGKGPATWRKGATTRTAAHATQRAARAKVAIQFLYHDRGARHSVATLRACTRVRATTRPSARHDTAPNARPGRSAHSVGAQLGSGCAPCAPNPVLTQCTVLSHCLGHYS